MSRTAQYAAHFAGSSEVEASPGHKKGCVCHCWHTPPIGDITTYKPLENEADPKYRSLDVDVDGCRVILDVQM